MPAHSIDPDLATIELHLWHAYQGTDNPDVRYHYVQLLRLCNRLRQVALSQSTTLSGNGPVPIQLRDGDHRPQP
jgi:hypothetical protein